jgi:cytochrome o ubiquinol oxidase subunit IV
MMRLAHNPAKDKEEHGSAKPYVIGFLLSLLFTAIPYYLVVNQIMSGMVLLAIILGIAFLQMLVQIVFFLHLGRGPSAIYNIVFFVFTAGLILVVVVGSMWIMHHLNYNMAPSEMSKKLIEKEGIHQIGGEKTGACRGVGTNHKVVLKEGKAAPLHVMADHCDTLTFINEDAQVRQIAFGDHPRHESYAGHADLGVRKGRNITITLSEPGTYHYHDHLDPELVGFFTVEPEETEDR